MFLRLLGYYINFRVKINMAKSIISENEDIYYSGQYWNDFPLVLEYMSENFTSDKDKWWVQDFKDRYAQVPYEKGLFLNCGNGWVERDFIDKKIVKKAYAFDYSFKLLKIAEKDKDLRPIHYFRTDVNKIDFCDNEFDLVVNVAALHHVQYINRLCHILCASLKTDGTFVNFDYIGPHRNQYSLRHWFFLQQVNNMLPKKYRKKGLLRPHLPTMLVNDPTEAIHSELIIETVSRYFDILERHDTGGGIGYELLTHNEALKDKDPCELDKQIEFVLSKDQIYTEQNYVPVLFSYFVAIPKKEVLNDGEKLKMYQLLEEKREQDASKRGGVYSTRDYIVIWLNKFQHQKIRKIMKSLIMYIGHVFIPKTEK